MSDVKRFPKKRGSPSLKPCCGQCGRELTGAVLRERDNNFEHELQSGVRLKLRVFADSSNPHSCGFVNLRIDSEEFAVGWMGDKSIYVLEWADLLALLLRCEGEGCEISQPVLSFADDGEAPHA